MYYALSDFVLLLDSQGSVSLSCDCVELDGGRAKQSRLNF